MLLEKVKKYLDEHLASIIDCNINNDGTMLPEDKKWVEEVKELIREVEDAQDWLSIFLGDKCP